MQGTNIHITPKERKDSQKITEEKERPIKRSAPIENKASQSSQPVKLQDAQMRGSKLVKDNGKKSDRIVR